MKSLALSRKSRLVLAGLALAAAGSFAAVAVHAQGRGPGGPDGFMMGGPMAGHMMGRMLDSVNATDAQKAQIRQIMDAARADMKAQHEAGRALRDQMTQLFTQPVVDAKAAEALRQQMLQQHDQVSRRMMQAMLDVSRVLTPEQRQQLAQKMKQRHDMMERHMRERQQLDGAPKN